MGFKFRKSVKMGPVRVNLSKSGVGYSVGGKGFRVTKKAGGGTRTTASIPGIGISYSTDSKKKKNTTAKKTSTTKTAKKNTAAAVHSAEGFTEKKTNGCMIGCLGFTVLCVAAYLVINNWKTFLILAILAAIALITFKHYQKSSDIKTDDTVKKLPVESTQETPVLEEVKTYTVAGVDHYLECLLSLMEPNDLYKYKKQELIDIFKTDEYIYKETIEDGKVELQPEPTNPHDPNAIRVRINGVLVGYVPAEHCAHLLDCIQRDKITNIAFTVDGGKYKMVVEDYDCIKDKSTYKMETGENDYKITLYIREKT